MAQGSGANCLWTFREDQVGEEFLFYLGEEPAIASICSRSNQIKWAAADVSYLEKINEVRGRTRISGLLSQYDSGSRKGERDGSIVLKDHEIRITGAGRDIRVKTDENGVYEVYGLPPGQYRIEPEKIKGYRANAGYRFNSAPTATVNLLSRSHVEANFRFETIGAQVSDHACVPVRAFEVSL